MKKILILCIAVLCVMLMAGCVKKNATRSSPSAAPTSVPSSGSVVIAESGNAVSDKQKQAVLDNLAREIDDAFNAGKILDDLDNSDLDPDNIP